MNSFAKSLLTIFITCIISTSLFAANEHKQPMQVVDAGMDGDERFYTVYCPSGKRAALVKRHKIGEVCTRPDYADKDICRDWTVDEAAEEACK